MTIHRTAPVEQPEVVALSTAVPAKTPDSKVAKPIQDTVHLSGAALAALLAKPAEATETPAQTLKEAGSGDPKALGMLAKK